MKKSPLDIMVEVKKLIADEKHWIKFQSYKAAEDGYLAYCLAGAVEKVATDDLERESVWYVLQSIINKKFTPVSLNSSLQTNPVAVITEFNDSGKTNHEMVMEVMDEAISRLTEAEKDE